MGDIELKFKIRREQGVAVNVGEMLAICWRFHREHGPVTLTPPSPFSPQRTETNCLYRLSLDSAAIPK